MLLWRSYRQRYRRALRKGQTITASKWTWLNAESNVNFIAIRMVIRISRTYWKPLYSSTLATCQGIEIVVQTSNWEQQRECPTRRRRWIKWKVNNECVTFLLLPEREQFIFVSLLLNNHYVALQEHGDSYYIINGRSSTEAYFSWNHIFLAIKSRSKFKSGSMSYDINRSGQLLRSSWSRSKSSLKVQQQHDNIAYTAFILIRMIYFYCM